MALRGELWQLFAGVQYRRRPALYQRLVKAAGEPLPPELVAELEQEEARELEEAEEETAEETSAAAAAAGAEAGADAGSEAEAEEDEGQRAAQRQDWTRTIGGGSTRHPGSSSSLVEGNANGETRAGDITQAGDAEGVSAAETSSALSTSDVFTPRAASRGTVFEGDEVGDGDRDARTPAAPTTDGGEVVDFATPPSTLPQLNTPFAEAAIASDGAGCGDGVDRDGFDRDGFDGDGVDGDGVSGVGVDREEGAVEPSTPSPASSAQHAAEMTTAEMAGVSVSVADVAVARKENRGNGSDNEGNEGEDDAVFTASSLRGRGGQERDVLPEIEESAFVKIKDQIEKDLPRTFPAHPLLDGIARDALK